MGADDPEAAARAAADPAAARRAMEIEAEREAALASRRERIWQGHQEGLILPGDPKKIMQQVRGADSDQLREWEAQLDQAEKDRIDEEEDQQATAALRGFMISPDDPTYQYIFDRGLRSRIEEDLEEIDFGQMIFDGFAEQDVKIRENLIITFRTIGTQHSLWLERRLHEASKMSEQYGRHWFGLLQLAVCLQKINGREIGTDLNAFDEESLVDKFWEGMKPRIKKVNRFPTEITDLLIANMAWFSGRVRKEIVGDLTEKVGNS
tara:strand:- start:133 stop:924 length:792 start_codon:yes stop_codon:yes gene_type:complete